MGSKFSRGRKMELSFIITRSDLLGHSKDKVDSLMPYLREVLRDALGRLGRNVRLGNVRCVSAKRNWWTTELKKEIFERGGAGWMVGKVNVGKSALFAEVFPKGHFSPTPPKHDITVRLSPPKIGEERQEPPNQLMPDSARGPEEAALLPPTRPRYHQRHTATSSFTTSAQNRPTCRSTHRHFYRRSKAIFSYDSLNWIAAGVLGLIAIVLLGV